MCSYIEGTDLRPVYQIAQEVRQDFLSPNKPMTSAEFQADVELRRAEQLYSCDEMYGMGYGNMVVARLLDTLQSWHGETAMKCKAELRRHLEVYNDLRGRTT